MNTFGTRVRNAVHSEIMNLSTDKIAQLKSQSKIKGGYGVSEMVRQLKRKQGFFVLCEEERRFSHVYIVAKEEGKDISVIRGKDSNDNLGYWVIHN